MATATTDYTSSTCPRVTLTISSSSSTENFCTYSWTLKYVVPTSYKMSTTLTKRVWFTVDGEKIYDKNITVGDKSSYTISTGTIKLSKTHSEQTITFKVNIDWGSATWTTNGTTTTLGVRSGSSSFTVAAATSYEVTYKANGGSGAPSSQTKWYGENLTLRTGTPTRTGYSFVGWNTSASATTASYSPGDTYTKNASLMLYAVWSKNYSAPVITNTKVYRCTSSGAASDDSTYAKVSFDWTIDSSVSNSLSTITINGTAVSNTGTSEYTVTTAEGASYGFELNSDGYYESQNKGVKSSAAVCVVEFSSLSAGAVITFDLINYAESKYDFGLLSELDSTLGTTYSIDNTYKWSGQNNNSADVQTVTYDITTSGNHYIYVKYRKDASTDSNNDSLMFKVSVSSNSGSSGSSGTVSEIISGVNVDSSTDIIIAVTDTYDGGTTTTKTLKLGVASYTMDFAAGGDGIGIGGVAPTNGLHVYMPMTYDIPVKASGDCNTLKTSGRYYIGSSGANRPIAQNGWLFVSSYNNNAYVYQEYVSHAGKRYYRVLNGGTTWGDWIFVPMIQAGTVSITPSAANTPTMVTVTFPISFSSTPSVTACAATSRPGTELLGVAVAAVSSTKANIWMTRNDTTTTTVHWQAIEQTT